MYFTPVRVLPEGTVYFTDLTPVRRFADWLDAFACCWQRTPALPRSARPCGWKRATSSALPTARNT